MIGFWDNKFEELAVFNSDKYKSKYNKNYLTKMRLLQKEYNQKQKEWAKANNYILVYNI